MRSKILIFRSKSATFGTAILLGLPESTGLGQTTWDVM